MRVLSGGYLPIYLYIYFSPSYSLQVLGCKHVTTSVGIIYPCCEISHISDELFRGHRNQQYYPGKKKLNHIQILRLKIYFQMDFPLFSTANALVITAWGISSHPSPIIQHFTQKSKKPYSSENSVNSINTKQYKQG